MRPHRGQWTRISAWAHDAAVSAPHRRRTTAADWRWALPTLLVLLPFLAWPLFAVVWRAATPEGTAPSAITTALQQRETAERLAFTAAQALASMLGTLFLGVPIAYVVARRRFPGRTLLRALATTPLVLPSIVVALGFQRLLDSD